MFTGIITNVGTCRDRTESGLVIETDSQLISQLIQGSSISVNGVCLTITHLISNQFNVDVMEETLTRTTLGFLKKGDPVNLELPLKADGRFDGHILQGHVDGIGTIKKIINEKNNNIFTISVAPELSRYMVEKGSIAVNGISLTVIDVNSDSFTVGIIPFTLKNTMLKTAVIGSTVNIEVDILAKYIEKFTMSLRGGTTKQS